MDFPVVPVKPVAKVPPGLGEALGVKPVSVCDAGWTWLVEVGDAGVVRKMAPDFTSLLKVPHGSAIVTSRSDNLAYDFLSRFFAPAVGVNEDPVTGSAHCSLAPFWAARLGRHELIGYQASRRGGVVKVALAGDRVKLRGQAVTVFAGTMAASA
jgi:predicted PhzF superfamily epimerase YddE/YHI9